MISLPSMRGGNPISQCEAAAALTFVLSEWQHLAGREVLLFVDNTAALHALVKGVSGNTSLARTVQLLHLLSYQLHVIFWFEYVPSSQNWADGISRVGCEDPWACKRGFETRRLEMKIWPWIGTLHECMGTIMSLGRSVNGCGVTSQASFWEGDTNPCCGH